MFKSDLEGGEDLTPFSRRCIPCTALDDKNQKFRIILSEKSSSTDSSDHSIIKATTNTAFSNAQDSTTESGQLISRVQQLIATRLE